MEGDQTGFSTEKRPDNDNRAHKPVEPAPAVAKPAPKQPGLGQRWSEARLTKTAALLYGIAIVAIILIFGFSWGGWMTSDSATKMASTMSRAAVVDRLAPICVAQYEADGSKTEKLAELKAMGTYAQADFVSEQGWATMPGEEKPDRQVAGECAKMLALLN